MGNWNISISGVGQHHNNLPKDVEVMFKNFVAELRTAGHTIGQGQAIITMGSAIYDEPQHPDGVIYDCLDLATNTKMGSTGEPQHVGTHVSFDDQEYAVISINHISRIYRCIKV